MKKLFLKNQLTLSLVKEGWRDLCKKISLTTNYQLPTTKPAFTLIELLVAMVITGIMLILVMASYWTFLQTQQKMTISRELQSEVRFALNRISDKVRSGRPNYPEYDTLTGLCKNSVATTGGPELCLESADGSTYFFQYDSSAKTLSLNGQFLISPQKFSVDSTSFNFSPKLDPTNLGNDQMQPKVTVYLRVNPRSSNYADLEIENQTTISSRLY